MLYTMLTRGRTENHVHVVLASPADPHQRALPGLGDQITATEVLEGILARDSAAVSATTTAVQSGRVEAQLHEAVARYGDAVARGAQRVLGAEWEDALDAAGAGPLPWPPGVPSEVGAHETWGPYLDARARRVNTLAGQVRSQARDVLPEWAERYADLLDGPLYSEVALWRAANGIADTNAASPARHRRHPRLRRTTATSSPGSTSASPRSSAPGRRRSSSTSVVVTSRPCCWPSNWTSCNATDTTPSRCWTGLPPASRCPTTMRRQHSPTGSASGSSPRRAGEPLLRSRTARRHRARHLASVSEIRRPRPPSRRAPSTWAAPTDALPATRRGASRPAEPPRTRPTGRAPCRRDDGGCAPLPVVGG